MKSSFEAMKREVMKGEVWLSGSALISCGFRSWVPLPAPQKEGERKNGRRRWTEGDGDYPGWAQ